MLYNVKYRRGRGWVLFVYMMVQLLGLTAYMAITMPYAGRVLDVLLPQEPEWLSGGAILAAVFVNLFLYLILIGQWIARAAGKLGLEDVSPVSSNRRDRRQL